MKHVHVIGFRDILIKKNNYALYILWPDWRRYILHPTEICIVCLYFLNDRIYRKKNVFIRCKWWLCRFLAHRFIRKICAIYKTVFNTFKYQPVRLYILEIFFCDWRCRRTFSFNKTFDLIYKCNYVYNYFSGLRFMQLFNHWLKFLLSTPSPLWTALSPPYVSATTKLTMRWFSLPHQISGDATLDMVIRRNINRRSIWKSM